MPETLLDIFEGYFNDLPETVRDDLHFMMVMLSDENLIVDEINDIDDEHDRCSRRELSLAV